MARTQINGRFINDGTIVPSADISTGASSQILVCDATGKLQFVNMSGGATISPTGVVTVASGGGNVQVISGGDFTGSGDAQAVTYVLRNITTNAVLTELFLDGISTQMLMSTLSSWTYNIKLVARRTDATGDYGSWIFDGLVVRGALPGDTVLIGSRNKTTLARTDNNFNAEVFADTITGAFTIKVIGATGKTVRWVATVQTTEVKN